MEGFWNGLGEVWSFIVPDNWGFPLLGNIVADGMEWWQWALVILDYSLKIVALGYVPSQRRPTSAMAWLLAIFLLPFIGIVLFMLIGSPAINRRRHRIQNTANEQIRTVSHDEPDIPDGHALSDELVSMVRLNRHLTAMPATSGTVVAVHSDYEATIRRMAEVVDKAENYVNCQIYITSWDSTTDVLFRALARAVERGVTVRYLFDHVGSWKYPGYRTLGRRLDEIGVQWMVTLPLQPWRWRFRRPDLRNHRKILVVDGHTGFMGSQNMIDSSYLMKGNIKEGRHWIDLMVELTGPVVSMLNSIFAVDWFTESDDMIDVLTPTEATRQLDAGEMPGDDSPTSGSDVLQLIPSGPGFTTAPNLRLFTSVAHHAKNRLILVSPYFIPDESLLDAVTTASYRGVDVELFVSEKADQALVDHSQSSYYAELLKAGVRIHQYPYPAVLHSKYAVADEDVVLVGSSNMDMRSFELNYEVTLMSLEGSLLKRLVALTDEYRSVSRELTAERWSRRNWWRRYTDNVARLTSALQ
jgi:cardiolipin synthase